MKKILYVLLAVMISLNALDVEASAAAAEAGAEFTSAIIPFIGNSLSDLINITLANSNSTELQKINQYAVEHGDFINLVEENGSFKFVPSVPLEYAGTEQEEFAIYFSNYLNGHLDNKDLIAGFSGQAQTDGAYRNELSVSEYQRIKSVVGQAFEDYLKAKEIQKSKIEGNDALAETGELPSYGFDFVGPIPGMTLPTSTGYVSTEMNGFQLFTPVMVTRTDGNLTEEQCKTLGATFYRICAYENDDPSKPLYCGHIEVPLCYGCGNYAIYNGKIYYWCRESHRELRNYLLSCVDVSNNYRINNIAPDGHTMEQDGCTSIIGKMAGLWICTDPNVTVNYPGEITPSDLIKTEGGETVNIPRSEAEETIGKAISSGIGNQNSLIGLDENGNITSFAGIPIETLKEALNQIASGENGQTISFDSIEGYLQRIIDILGEINAKEANVEENVNEKTLDEINENLKTIAESITAEAEAEAEEVDTKFDVKTPATITDKFPFSLPFDIHKMFNLLSHAPVAPKFKFDLDMTPVGGDHEVIEVDLAQYNWLAEIVRWLIYVAAVIGLILATNKLIGRG